MNHDEKDSHASSFILLIDKVHRFSFQQKKREKKKKNHSLIGIIIQDTRVYIPTKIYRP